MKRSVLIVEDEEDIRELLSYTLIREGYQVATVSSGEEALAVAEARTPDLVLLDLMLPGLDGLTVCRKLRANPQTADVAIVMLTAKGEEGDIVTGLNMGANDYITKPFSRNVLLARVRAVLRHVPLRGEPGATDDPDAEIKIHDVAIHPGRHVVQVAGHRVELSATEFRILCCLARKPGWVFTREQILDAVHGDNYAITDRAVDVHIASLRKKLGAAGPYIETVRGVGYRFKEQSMRKPRLLWQVLLGQLAILIVLILGLEWYASYWARESYKDRQQEKLETVATVCEARILDLLERGANDEVQAFCDELTRAVSLRITVILPSGQVVADTSENPQQMELHMDRPEVQVALGGAVGRFTRFSHTLGERLTYVAVPLRRGASVAAVVRTAFPVQTLRETVREVYLRIALVAVTAIGLAALVSLLAAWRTTQPLEVLRQGAERFARGELKHRLPNLGAEEIRRVADALNHMAAELDQRLETIVRQENEHQAVLSSMVEGVLAVDHDSTILSLNAAGAELLGVAPERVCGRLIHEAIRRASLLTFVERTLASPEPVEQEFGATGPSNRWLHAHGTVLHDGQQRKIGALIVMHDVTRLRQLERIRRDFVANVSHELKTPITSIKGFVETLLHEQLEDKENSLRFLGIILRQANRLDAIIGDLLMLSRLERGTEEQTIQLQRESLCAVLQAAVEMCAQKAADKQMRLDLECPDDLQAQINAPLLEQAVTNLIDNAIKYSEAGAVIRLAAASAGAEVTVRVEDQGCGIEAIHLPRLFERFYRVDRARSRELGGTGLGLAIVKHIVAAHRGTVTVASTVGQGSTFCVHLPAGT